MTMEALREPGPPSIYIDQNPSERFYGSSRSSFGGGVYSSSPAMSIPGASTREDVPPPLPPPRFPLSNTSHCDPRSRSRLDSSYSQPFSPRDPSYGSFGTSLSDDRPHYKRRESSTTIKPERDEGYASLSSTRYARNGVICIWVESHRPCTPSIFIHDCCWIQANFNFSPLDRRTRCPLGLGSITTSFDSNLARTQ
jgi:hypothetical protein